ncbi:hypothetical protein [Methylobacterium sp. CM6247]
MAGRAATALANRTPFSPLIDVVAMGRHLLAPTAQTSSHGPRAATR